MAVKKVPYSIIPDKKTLVQVDLADSIQDGRVDMDLNNEWNFGYIGTFYLGSNKQPIRAIFDTGSANSWILSKEAIKGQSDEDEFSPFDQTESETFEEMLP